MLPERWKVTLGNELSVTYRAYGPLDSRGHLCWRNNGFVQWTTRVAACLTFVTRLPSSTHLSLKLISGRAFPLSVCRFIEPVQIDVLLRYSPISTEWMFNSSVIQPAVRSVRERAIDALIQFCAN